MDPLILNLTADNPVHEMASMCMDCLCEGSTRLMLTKIPYFKEVIISSFSCPSCHNTNNSVQPASSYADRGVTYTLTVRTEDDLNRQIIKSESGVIRIPELELEIPAESQRGSSSTVEGFLTKTRDGIKEKQEERRAVDPGLASQLDQFLGRLEAVIAVTKPFTVILRDPTGNSFVENPSAPSADPDLRVEYFVRTKDDEDELGITEIREGAAAVGEEHHGGREEGAIENEHTDVISFDALCNACGKDAQCNMKEVEIPFFKKILLMANVCDHCGFRDSEVKSAGGIGERGQRITLTMTESEMDLNRDILKSETARIEIPELEMVLTSGALGGRFTTVEGLLSQMRDQLKTINPFAFGDSASAEGGGRFAGVIAGIDQIIEQGRLVTVVLVDPAGNSYIQNVYAPDQDPHLLVEEFERSREDDDDLGITDMKTENYGEEEEGKREEEEEKKDDES